MHPNRKRMKHAPNAPKQEANEKCNGMNGGGEKAQHGYVSDEAQMLVCVCVCVFVCVDPPLGTLGQRRKVSVMQRVTNFIFSRSLKAIGWPSGKLSYSWSTCALATRIKQVRKIYKHETKRQHILCKRRRVSKFL